MHQVIHYLKFGDVPVPQHLLTTSSLNSATPGLDEQQFKQRTKTLALRVIRLVETLPTGMTTGVISKQLLRSATSVGANY